MSEHNTAGPRRTKSKPAVILPAAQEPACDECRIRKVRCNKEYPKCSSCRKSNLACGFSNKGKRINHTKKLVNDVEVLGNRLGKIEEALLRCLSVVESSQTPPNGMTGQASTQSEHGQVDLSDDSHSDSDSRDSPSTGSGQYTPVAGSSPVSTHHSNPTLSLYTQAQAACGRLESSFALNSPLGQYSPVPPELHGAQPINLQSRLNEASQLLGKLAQESPILSIPESDGLPPCLPPQGLLQSCLEAYFVPLGLSLPIYDRSTVIAAIEEQYSIDSPDPAWIISFSTILLQALDVQSRANRAEIRGTFRDELISNLLLNCRRSYNNFERLLRPQVANVQALLSMALVALKYFSLATFEAVFAQACQLAKSIGLHQPAVPAADTSERTNLFWSLFIIDKHTSLVAGKPSLLPSYDCGLPPPASSTGHGRGFQLAARISLAYIQEDMYRSLFSARVSRKGRDHITRQVQRIDRKLDDWEVQQEGNLSYASEMPSDEAIHNAELRYTLCTLRVLVQRRIPGPDHRHTRLRHARFGLVLLKDMCERRLPGSPHLGITMFQSICVNYSTILFLELFIGLLEEPQHDHRTDVELLASFVTHMDRCAAKSSSTSYPAKNSYMAMLCSQIATNIQMLHDGIAPPLTLSIPNSLPDSPGIATISSASASTFETEMMETSPGMGMPSSTLGDPGWDLSLSLGTPFDIHKIDSLQGKVYAPQSFDPNSPYSGFPYSEIRPVDFDAMLEAFASYQQDMGMIH